MNDRTNSLQATDINIADVARELFLRMGIRSGDQLMVRRSNGAVEGLDIDMFDVEKRRREVHGLIAAKAPWRISEDKCIVFISRERVPTILGMVKFGGLYAAAFNECVEKIESKPTTESVWDHETVSVLVSKTPIDLNEAIAYFASVGLHCPITRRDPSSITVKIVE